VKKMNKNTKFSWSRVLYMLTILVMLVPASAWATPVQQQTEQTLVVPPPSSSSAPSFDAGQPSATTEVVEIESTVTRAIQQKGNAGYLVYFRDRPSLEAAEHMDWIQRGRFVLQQLQSVAKSSQKNVRDYLDSMGVSYQSFWIDNVILVEGSDITVLNGLKNFPEISIIRDRRIEMLVEPASKDPFNNTNEQTFSIEPNITHVQAPDAWALGINGLGSVVSSIDTGVRYSHQALVGKYRGNLGSGTFDHNYNWWDPYGDHPFAPADDYGHGSHTMGTMVGDDGGSNQIGMAPGAKWIACRGCNSSGCTDAALLSCAQFITAPWDLNGANPNPDLRPDAVNNSWGDCGQSYDSWFRGVVDSWRAAGIYPVFSNGNSSNCDYSSPPPCGTVGNPARYGNVTGVGATGQQNGAYATFSLRGPTDNADTENGGDYPNIKPQVVAPGVNIRSSVNTSDTAYEGGWSGTSMAAPHVTGLTALIYQAGACLKGDFTATENIIQQSAAIASGVPGTCSGEGPGQLPNQSTGWGEIRALAAVQLALTSCGPMGTLEGTVTETGFGSPIEGATVQVIGTELSFEARTNAFGYFSLSLPVDTYTVDVSAYGYMPAFIPGVVIEENLTTTLNVTLDPAPSYTVSGKIFDPAAGWGLYTKITIGGYSGAPIWTDPATGNYSISLVAGQNYTFNAVAFSAGYLPAVLDTGVLTGDLLLDIPVQADANNCTAPGYVLDVTGIYETFESATFPPAGWTVTNNGGNCSWVGDDPGVRGNLTGGTGKFAIADSDSCGSGTTMDTTLTSPIMDVSTLANVILSYNYDYNNLNSSESADLDVSADGGATWTNVHHWNTDMRGPNTFTQDVTALLGGSTQAQLRYHYIVPGWDWWWEVDNVFVGEKLCHPIGGGGLVVGRVADANDNHALVGAKVTSDTGAEATAAATVDPAMDNFYALFQPVGDHTLTATMQNYSPAVATVSVPMDNAVRQDFALQTGHLTYTPTNIDVTILAGGSTTVQVTVNNIGGGVATFQLLELDKGSVVFGPIEDSEVLVAPGQQDTSDALSLGLPPGPVMEPLAAGDIIQSWTTGMATPWGIAFDGLDGTVWIGDGWGTLDAVKEFATDGTATGRQWPYSWPTTNGPADMTYNWNTGMLWSMNINTGVSNCIYEIDPNSGPTGNTICPGGGTGFSVSQRGLAYDPATDTYFAGNWTDLMIHRFDSTGAILSSVNVGISVAGLAYNPETEHLFVVDSATTSKVYVLDVANNYAPVGQFTIAGFGSGGAGMELDCDGNLWLASQSDDKVYQVQSGETASLCAGEDVPWLSEAPTTATVPAGGSVTVDVTLDSTVVAPGVYSAQLKFTHDTPYDVPNLPVKMTASIPPTMGKLAGTVSTDGYCDNDPAPLANVPVTVNSASFSSPLVLTTDVNGYYYAWLDQSVSPLAVDVNAGSDYYTGSATGVILTGQQTTIQDFTLRYNQPCLNATPSSILVTIPLGTSTTKPLTLRNTGGADANFAFDNIATGYTLPSTQSQPANTVTIGDLNFSVNPNPPTKSSDPNTGNARKVTAGSTTITQSNSQEILSGNSISCNDGIAHTDNHYLRIFDLPTFGINSDFAITNVSFGIELSEPSGATQPLEVRLYTLNGAFQFANLTPIGSATAAVTNQSLTILDVPVTGTAPVGSKLVVDIFTPNGQTAGNLFFIGSNGLGETGPSYLAAADCGAPEPVTVASLGFPEMMIVMNVTGNVGGGLSGPATWLSEAPPTGTVPSDGMQSIVVTFDANQVNKPGTYKASATVNSNDPQNQALDVQTTMVVTAPANWGVLKGTISSLGHCDANPAPLTDATVLVTGSNGMTRTATTGANGAYEFWLPDYASPYTIQANQPEHLPASAGGIVVTGLGNTTQDLSLRWMRSCVTETPPVISATVEWQQSTTKVMTLANTGAADTSFKISEMPGQFIPMGVTGNQVLVVNDSGSNTNATNAFTQALDNLGYSYDVVSSSSGSGIPANPLNYQVVFYAGVPSSGAEQNQLVAYLDAGGRLVIADNDFGYSDRTTVLYQTYFEATYVADAGSDGVIHGVDLEAGIDVDISSDPYPDSFTIGPDAIGIFANTAPRVNWAGMRIARQAYKAIYFAWDYYYAGGLTVGDPVETEILGMLMPWLTAADIDWLTATPDQGELAVDTGLQSVIVGFNASAASVLQPGTYTAQLKIETNDPVNDTIQVPVNMVVNPSPTYGKLWGTVRGLGACDLNPAPIEGAQVDILVGTETITLETDANGYYQYWFTAAYPTIGLSVTAADHLGENRAVFFWSGADPANQEDFDLHWLQPCGSLAPASLSATVTLGEASALLPAYINNSGWAPLNFSLRGKNTGFVPMNATTAGEDVLLVASTSTIADAVAASLTRMGYTYYRVTASTLPPVETWTTYSAVIWTGSPSGSTNTGLIKSYLDAGGAFLITYNDLGYFYGTDTLYTDYLEASYTGADAGSDGWITGADIMAGLHLDISADPYPDSFTITGPNAVAIFTNDAPKTDLSGLRISKNDYKAIYLAWNFNYTGTTDAEKDAVLGKAMNWLAPSATWIQPVPNSGTVAEGSTQLVEVTLNAGDPSITQPGTYLGDLNMSNNTPGKGMISIPVTMIVTPPATWGKLQGTVQGLGYCDASPAPLADALVTITTAGGATVPLKTDNNGFYSYWFDQAASPVSIAVNAADHASGSASATIVGGQTTTQDFNLRWLKPCSSVDPTSFNVIVQLGSTLDQPLTLFNNGAAATDWELVTVGVANVAQPVTIAPVPGASHNGASLMATKALGMPNTFKSTVFTPHGPINLVIDDGSAENSIGVTDGVSSYQFIWMNRFTPNAADFPFNLEEISILWPVGQVSAGNIVELVVYQDTDGDGDPSNGELMGTYNVTIQNVDGTTWDSYTLATPLLLGGPGDVLIGAINRWVTSGVSPSQWPANIDQTTSQGRSWIGWWNTDPPTPPALPPDNTFGTIDSLGFAGNWMIRASGTTASGVPWLTVDPAMGNLAADSQQTATVHFNAAAEGITTGVYQATLRYNTSDPVNPAISIPVSMSVGQLVTITKQAQEQAFFGSGEVLHYTLVATNAGNTTLTGVSISDPKLGTLTCTQPVDLAPGATLTCTGMYTTKTSDLKSDFSGSVVNTATVTATITTISGTNSVSATATATVPQTTTRLDSTGMTCQQFAASGKSAGLTMLKYTVKKGKISAVSPTTMTLYEKFTTTKANFSLVIDQSNTGGWVPIALPKGTAVTLYNANCVKSSALGAVVYDPATGTLTINVTGATPGANYFIAVKFNPASLVGTPIKAPNPTVTYKFVTKVDGVALPTGEVTLKVAPK
jgi:hypothetical protein